MTGSRAVAELARGVVPPAVGPVVRGRAAAMQRTRGHPAELEVADDRGWRRPTRDSRPIAELTAVDVGSPAVGPIVQRHAAGVLTTRTYREELQLPDDADRYQATTVDRAMAQLAPVVSAPAEGAVQRGHAAAVEGTRAYLSEPACSKDCYRHQTIGGCTVADLAEAVASPAVASIVSSHAAGVSVACGHLAEL